MEAIGANVTFRTMSAVVTIVLNIPCARALGLWLGNAEQSFVAGA